MKWPPQIGSADAYNIAKLIPKNEFVFVLTKTASEAQRLTNELRIFCPNKKIRLFPDWETLPYERFSPHLDLISERLETLYQSHNGKCDCVISPIATALNRLPPTDYLDKYSFILNAGETIETQRLKNQLRNAGYQHVSQVVSPGEYCIRGGVIDIYPMGSVLPYRIDLFDNEIDKIRTFDPDTQRGIYQIKTIRLLPAREFPTDANAVQAFRSNFRETIPGDPVKSKIYKNISTGSFPPGVEYYLPLFFSKTNTITNYIPSNSLVCTIGNLSSAIKAFWEDTEKRYGLLRGDSDNPLLPPHSLFQSEHEFFNNINLFSTLEIVDDKSISQNDQVDLPDIAIEKNYKDPLSKLKKLALNNKNKIIVFADSLGRRQTMQNLFDNHNLKHKVEETWTGCLSNPSHLILTIGPLAKGFAEINQNIYLVSEGELYPAHARTSRKQKPRNSPENMLRNLSEIKIDDLVVHIQHGIGKYQGLKTMDLGHGVNEFLEILYDDSDKLFVPVSQLGVIGRYSGNSNDTIALNKLGSGKWEKSKKKAAKKARDTAAELLDLYAQRSSKKGHQFSLNKRDFERFCQEFEFEETVDQLAAINATVSDLRSEKPMDRLICGDVGFGKTEVALRASFIAATEGKQVAILVPTTLLAEQHFHTFKNRFANWGVTIEEFSRFKTGKESQKILESLESGKTDIVIGTHKLISKQTKFKNLGLIIIDEEHRFGVRHKEKLKSIRTDVDVLTLTATPIPRTLAMSLEGFRDFSIISTAPEKRLAIKTFVAEYSEGLIREATLRELKRGGQIYFLHNSVDSIVNMKSKLTTLLPEVRIEIAHGQMRERELEKVMKEFYRGSFNLLLCTTIIETGIDVPAANTIIIDRSDKLGLAQLHQLRGRVGRSHHQAYAYLLTPDEDSLKNKASKRLDAIQMMEELGSGFYLAIQDMEIRGAGEVLGDSQSGEMNEVGFQLYCEMLDRAVRSLKSEKEPMLLETFDTSMEVNLPESAILPDSYCSNVHQRLIIYKRLANCSDQESLISLVEEITDRFGLPTDPVKALIWTHEIRVSAKKLGIKKIDVGKNSSTLQFVSNPQVSLDTILKVMATNKTVSFSGPENLRVKMSQGGLASKVVEIKSILRQLSDNST